MSCFQCELDIPHVCYEGWRDARWGLGDEAMAALEGAQRHGFLLTAEQRRARQAKKCSKKPRRTR